MQRSSRSSRTVLASALCLASVWSCDRKDGGETPSAPTSTKTVNAPAGKTAAKDDPAGKTAAKGDPASADPRAPDAPAIDDGTPVPEIEANDTTPTSKADEAGETVELETHGRTQTVHVGDTLELRVRDAAMGMSDEYRYGWDDPIVDGAAVRFVERTVQRPPDDVDGGSDTNVFRLRAIAEGTATITIPVRNAGAEAYQDDVVVKVKVAAAR